MLFCFLIDDGLYFSYVTMFKLTNDFIFSKVNVTHLFRHIRKHLVIIQHVYFTKKLENTHNWWLKFHAGMVFRIYEENNKSSSLVFYIIYTDLLCLYKWLVFIIRFKIYTTSIILIIWMNKYITCILPYE